MDAADDAVQASIRAEQAAHRTQELAERLQRLAQGHRSDPDDLRLAQTRADEAAERAVLALERSVQGHERAARSHEMTAAAHDRAARRGVGNPEEHRRLAAQHRHDAHLDMVAAAGDRALAAAERERTTPTLSDAVPPGGLPPGEEGRDDRDH